MNSFWLVATLALVGLCHSQLVCAGTEAIDEFLDAKGESLINGNLDDALSALHELRSRKIKGIKERVVGSLTNDLVDEMLEAASWIEQKNCTDRASHYKFGRWFRSGGSSYKLLLRILNERDTICARDLLQREQQFYSTLDSTQTSKVEKLEQLTLKDLESRVFADKKKYQSSDLVWTVANKYSLNKDLLNPAFYDSLLAYLEGESQKDRCQFLGEELKDLTKQHISSPCDYFDDEARLIYLEHQRKFPLHVDFVDGVSSDRDSLNLNEYLDFNHHLIGYKVCRFINVEQKSALIQNLAEELSTQCLKRIYSN